MTTLDMAPNPREVAAYLRQQGWYYLEASDTWARYKKTLGDEQVVLEVPQKSTAPDYSKVFAMLIDDLTRLEARPTAQILTDIRAVGVDIIRFGFRGSATRDGRIPVEAGFRVYEAARNALLAAACSVLDPRAVFPKRKPDEAMRLLNTARFGQTEIGSFVLTVECPVAPLLRAPASLTGASDEITGTAPFERKTSLLLARALFATADAYREASATGEAAPFRRGTQNGISANLCDAIAEMLEVDTVDSLSVRFSYSPARPVDVSSPREILFPSEAAPVLREASMHLKETAYWSDVDVLGTVLRLNSQQPTTGGEAVLWADIEGKTRRVHVELGADFYQLAVQAHGNSQLVRCRGDLTKERGVSVLRNPHEFSLENVESAQDELF